MRVRRFQRGGVAAILLAAATVAGGAAGPAGAEGARTRASLPALLSQTGLYGDARTLTIDPRNRSFVPQYPLWTDGATKRRWIRIPDGQAIDASRIDAWEFPAGTTLWKEFSFAGRRVETRVLKKVSATRWDAASYVWNGDGTDAQRAPARGVPAVAEIAPGKWHAVPSVDECRACHDSSRMEPLGFTALQLSGDRDPLAVHAEPVHDTDLTFARLQRAGLLRRVAAEYREAEPRIPAASPRERAALGYLSANCGACHTNAGPLAPLGLSFRQAAFGGGLDVVRAGLAKRTKWDRPGAPPETTHVVDPAVLEQSALLLRMASRRPASQMPPLGSVVADREALDLLTAWLREDLPLARTPRSVTHTR